MKQNLNDNQAVTSKDIHKPIFTKPPPPLKNAICPPYGDKVHPIPYILTGFDLY